MRIELGKFNDLYSVIKNESKLKLSSRKHKDSMISELDSTRK